MQRYAPSKMELAPRDMVSRAEMTEILEGRGFPGPEGKDYLHLDLTHLGADRINQRLPLIREVCIKFIGVDPIEKPIPIRPVAHYSMGGIETDINGLTRMPGVWAAGEAACVSLHGANRLGSNSTAECLVWGGITGAEIAAALPTLPAPLPDPGGSGRGSGRITCASCLSREGKENLYDLRRELRATMDRYVGVFRKREDLAAALDDDPRHPRARAARRRSPTRARSTTRTCSTPSSSRTWSIWRRSRSWAPFAREESRGAHARRDFAVRDDEKWLRHTLAWRTDGEPRLDYKPVTIDTWKPVERKY